MAVKMNHTIAICEDGAAACQFVAEIVGLETSVFGMNHRVHASNEVTVDFITMGSAGPFSAEIKPQHFAFLVSDEEFDEIFARVSERGLRFWGDPTRQVEGVMNSFDGGRGFFFEDPNGHWLEVFTREYGSAGAFIEDLKAFLAEHGKSLGPAPTPAE